MGYFLNHTSNTLYKELHDLYHRPDPIKAARTARSWDITGAKRRKGLLKWTHSLAGRRFYRKLARHKAMHENYDTFFGELLEYINDYLRLEGIGSAWFNGDVIEIRNGMHRGVMALSVEDDYIYASAYRDNKVFKKDQDIGALLDFIVFILYMEP